MVLQHGVYIAFDSWTTEEVGLWKDDGSEMSMESETTTTEAYSPPGSRRSPPPRLDNPRMRRRNRFHLYPEVSHSQPSIQRANLANLRNFCPSCPWLPGASSPLMVEKSGHGGAPRKTTRTCPSVLKPRTVWATSWGSSSKKSPRQTMSGTWCCATNSASGSISHAMTLRRGPKSCCNTHGPVAIPSNQLRTTKPLPSACVELGTNEIGELLPEQGSTGDRSGISPTGSGETPCCPYFLFLDQDWSHWSWCQPDRPSFCHWLPWYEGHCWLDDDLA